MNEAARGGDALRALSEELARAYSVSAAYVVSDPRLGGRKRPGARGVYQRREYATEVRINALGMRDPERAAELLAGECADTYPIACVRLAALLDARGDVRAATALYRRVCDLGVLTACDAAQRPVPRR